MELKKWFLYPSEAFDSFECFMSGELVTIVAESNSGKTTFAMDIISRNADRWCKGFYINLEFPIETMWQSRWLWLNWKSKLNLTDIAPLTKEENDQMDAYVKQMLGKFDYYNEPNWIELDKLLQIISLKAMEGYDLIVIDTFSRIHGNLDANTARTSQNRCMEQLQEIAQRLWLAIVVLHHTNRAWTFEGSQKIMDLSNVFIQIEKDIDAEDVEYRRYTLSKDKFINKKTLELYYKWWEYLIG